MHEINDTAINARKKTIDYLQEKGFFQLDTPDSTLENEIHPISAYKNFSNLSNDAYENMKPGLHLASLYLQDERVCGNGGIAIHGGEMREKVVVLREL
jgi:hypothetical protein